jgi:hypothetical protein
MRRYLDTEKRRRQFNYTMAALLVLSILPVLWELPPREGPRRRVFLGHGAHCRAPSQAVRPILPGGYVGLNQHIA